MTLPVDAATKKRLLLVKRIHRRGVDLIEDSQNQAEKIIGLITLDLSIETILNAILIDKVDAKDRKFHEWLDLANKCVIELERHDGSV